MLAAQTVEETTGPGPAADLEASDPSPASHDTVEASTNSCSRNDSKAPQETENTHFALCLVHCLKSSGSVACFSVTLEGFTIVVQVQELEIFFVYICVFYELGV